MSLKKKDIGQGMAKNSILCHAVSNLSLACHQDTDDTSVCIYFPDVCSLCTRHCAGAEDTQRT